jgi:hypothetical protein
VGIFAPAAAGMFGQSLPLSWDTAFASFVLWLSAAMLLHIEARQTIATLKE